jgi:hypothetical protein
LYIQIKDGVAFEHPIMEDNFLQAFPDVDVNNLPPELAKFTRFECNVVCEKFEVPDVRYIQNGDTWEDGWYCREMTDIEKSNATESFRELVVWRIGILKSYAQDEFVNVPEEYKAVWQGWIDAMNAYVITDPYIWRDPALDTWPFNPLKQNEDGSWELKG